MNFKKDKFDFGGVVGMEYRIKKGFILDLSFSQSVLENDWELVFDDSNNPFTGTDTEDLIETLGSRYSSFSLTIGLEM